ncbi:hypothetical protein P7K49_006652, partial [Saguinus oedipus]
PGGWEPQCPGASPRRPSPLGVLPRPSLHYSGPRWPGLRGLQGSPSGVTRTPALPFPGRSSPQAALPPRPIRAQKAPEEPTPREERPLLIRSPASLFAFGARRPLLSLLPPGDARGASPTSRHSPR